MRSIRLYGFELRLMKIMTNRAAIFLDFVLVFISFTGAKAADGTRGPSFKIMRYNGWGIYGERVHA